MYKIIFIFILPFCVAASLDSLVELSKISERQSRRLHGLFISHDNERDTGRIIKQPINNFVGPILQDNNYVLQQLSDLKVEQAKTDIILENLQKQSDKHSDNSDFILKLVELSLGAFTSLAVATIGLFVKGKKKDD